MNINKIKSSYVYLINLLVTLFLLLVILSNIFKFEIKESDCFEDGSGRIVLTYCIPGKLCE